MKNLKTKIIVCSILFVAALIIISKIMNMGNTDLTVEMGKATFPMVYTNVDGETVNGLYGYANEMKGPFLRDNLTPLPVSRTLPIVVECFGTPISKIFYEVRSLDMQRLVENTEVFNYTEQDDKISADLNIKELIDPDVEYMLTVILETEIGKQIRYYTRIVQAEDIDAGSKIRFVKDFCMQTFDRDRADREGLSMYIESNAEGDNSNYGYVAINSSFKQITWGDLQVERVNDLLIDIKEMNAETASFQITYLVFTMNGKEKEFYNVTEYYRIRQGEERIFLLDFERNMEQLFNPAQDVFINNKILLGITKEIEEFKESEDGSIVCFVKENSLYSFNNTEEKIACLFSFYNEDNSDRRSLYNNHSIKILKVDESGTVRFLVYGYMNRGSREGEVGIAVYHYDSVANVIEEDIYISYDKSYSLLKENIENHSYLNGRNKLFLFLDGAMYKVDLLTKDYSIVASGLTDGRFVVSDSNSMAAWQDGSDKYKSKQLILMDLNKESQSTVSAGDGNSILPIGFIDDDFIYGIARDGDIVYNNGKVTLFPMYTLRIQDKVGNILKEYKEDGVYSTDTNLIDNLINISRVRKNGEGYVKIEDHKIMNGLVETPGKNELVSVITEAKAKISQISLTSSIDIKNLKLLNPREVLYEGGRNLVLESKEGGVPTYYVYVKEGVTGFYTEVNTAVNSAVENTGIVVNDRGDYIFERVSRKSKMQVSDIGPMEITEEKNSLAVCLDVILKKEGILKNSEYLLNNGGTPISILEDNLNASVLDLSGCTLDSMFYYINEDKPVMALVEDNQYVLVIGYDELNTILMDPRTGTIFRKGMNDSKTYFESYGNKFISYIKNTN